MKTPAALDQLAYSARHWWLSLLSGVLFIIAGSWVMRTPVESYIALAVLFSTVFLANGIMEIFTAISERHATKGWGWILAGGIIDVVVGMVLVSNPAISLAILPFVVGFGLLFRSVMAIAASVELQRNRVRNWGWLLALGIAGMLFSFLLLRNPMLAGFTIVAWTAMAFFSIGFFRIWLAFQLKELKKALPSGA